MKEVSDELLDELEKLPIPKPRKGKRVERTHRDWFYNVITRNGDCTNPNCTDDRGKAKGVTQVWTHPKGESMCRFCFLGGWLDEANH